MYSKDVFKKRKISISNGSCIHSPKGLNKSILLSLDDSFLGSVDFDSIEKRTEVQSVAEPAKDTLLDLACSTDENTLKQQECLKNRLRTSLVSNATRQIQETEFRSSESTTCEKEIQFYGLPLAVKHLLGLHKNITDLYEWQKEVLDLKALSQRQNMLLILPTSGGKTLIAEILILREILCHRRNVIFVLPYISLVHEKVNSLCPFALELGFQIEEFAGAKGKFPPTKRRKKCSVFVCTIEKSDTLVTSLIEENRLEEIGLLVIDEFHLIGESDRGSIIENLIVKVRYKNSNSQIIALSATVGNPAEIADFLNGFVYTNHFRPVSLNEYVKIDDEIFRVCYDPPSAELVFFKRFKNKSSYRFKDIDPDLVGLLVQETIPSKSCLVFCPSKKNCENVAELICKILPKELLGHKSLEKKSLLRALKVEGNGNICKILKRTIPYGVVYHHSGLTTGERKILEEAYMNSTISCICCTSTLAAGVNLPAARVILRSPFVGTSFISFSQYKQMVGRAGRAGLEDHGESYLLGRGMDSSNILSLLRSSIGNCDSQLLGSGLYKLTLSSLSLGLANSLKNLLEIADYSLLRKQIGKERLQEEVCKLINELKSNNVINDSFMLTDIGKGAVKGNFTIEVADQLYQDLQQARTKLVLTSNLHLLYLVTPYNLDELKPTYEVLISVLLALDIEILKVASAIGITEATIAKIVTGRGVPSQIEKILKRFFGSLILNDLVNGKSIWETSNKFGLNRGFIYNFVLSSSSFASAVLRFCEVFPQDMWCFSRLLSELPMKISFCCSQELIPLMELTGVRLGRARQLYNAGFTTVQRVAQASPSELTSAIDLLHFKQAKTIISSAKMFLITKAETLQEEASAILKEANLS